MHQIKTTICALQKPNPKNSASFDFLQTWAVNKARSRFRAPVALTLAKLVLNEKKLNGMSNLAS